MADDPAPREAGSLQGARRGLCYRGCDVPLGPRKGAGVVLGPGERRLRPGEGAASPAGARRGPDARAEMRDFDHPRGDYTSDTLPAIYGCASASARPASATAVDAQGLPAGATARRTGMTEARTRVAQEHFSARVGGLAFTLGEALPRRAGVTPFGGEGLRGSPGPWPRRHAARTFPDPRLTPARAPST